MSEQMGPGSEIEATTASAASPASADMIHTVTKLDRAVKERRDTDTELVNWWLYFLLLSWITIGIYGIYLFFKRIGRIDGFTRRKRAYYEAVIEWTEREATAKNREDEVHHELEDLKSEIARAYQGDLRPIKAGLSFVLTLVTIGFYGLYVLYRMNRYWWDAQVVEQDFDDKLSQLWTKLGVVRYPINFQTDQSKRRSYALYLILSFVTIGIWGLVWDYKIHTDPDNLYRDFHGIEDSILQTVRSH
jgi:hypothetical protein